MLTGQHCICVLYLEAGTEHTPRPLLTQSSSIPSTFFSGSDLSSSHVCAVSVYQPCVVSWVFCDLLNARPRALASRSRLSIHVDAGLLPAAGQALLEQSLQFCCPGAAGCPGWPGRAAPQQDLGARCSPAGNTCPPEPCSTPAGLSHQGRKIPVAPWLSLFLLHRRRVLK